MKRTVWLVWQIFSVWFSWYMGQEVPHHMAKGRAKWSKYLRDAWEGVPRTTHRMRKGWGMLPAMELVRSLQKEREKLAGLDAGGWKTVTA